MPQCSDPAAFQCDFTDAGSFFGIRVKSVESCRNQLNDEVQIPEHSPGNNREELLQQCRVQRGRQTCVVIDSPLHAANVGCILRQARRFESFWDNWFACFPAEIHWHRHFFWTEFNISTINEVENELMRNLAMNNKQMICQMNKLVCVYLILFVGYKLTSSLSYFTFASNCHRHVAISWLACAYHIFQIFLCIP